MKKPLEAFNASEHTKARLFAERIAKRAEQATLGVPDDVKRRDRELNDSLDKLKSRRPEAHMKVLSDKDKEAGEELESEIMQLEKELAEHKKMLREKYPLFAATMYPQPGDLSQAALKDDEWVLAFDVTHPGLIVYLTKGKKLVTALYKPIPREKIDDLIKQFRSSFEKVDDKNLKNKLEQFDFNAAKRLADILLSDVLKDIPEGAPLIIVPDDSLQEIPFEILALNEGGRIEIRDGKTSVVGAQFFGDRNPLSYYQSVTALTLARTYHRKKVREESMLVMANPVFRMDDKRAQQAPAKKVAGIAHDTSFMKAVEEANGPGGRWRPLPHTGKLAEALASMYKGAKVYTGIDASKDTFLQEVVPNLDKYGNVVFATHGSAGNEVSGIMEPVLVLTLVPPGTDGYLRMSEVMGPRMNADMVALTACQSGLGARLSGEGAMGMGRAFQHAGANTVMISLWSVEEKASVNLVETFFKLLKEGKTKPEALRLARKRIRDAGYDHPFYWAPFILVGEVN